MAGREDLRYDIDSPHVEAIKRKAIDAAIAGGES